MSEDQIEEVMEMVRLAMASAMLAGERILETDGSFDRAFEEGVDRVQAIKSKLKDFVSVDTLVVKMKTPENSGKITGKQIKERMMAICGCLGKYDCDCVSIKNRAISELWY
ncbi:MAG: hypothetical protein ACRCVU_20235, partial [Flavobacterium sp.]